MKTLTAKIDKNYMDWLKDPLIVFLLAKKFTDPMDESKGHGLGGLTNSRVP